MAHAADTEVLTVQAGDTIEVAHTTFDPEFWTDEQWYDCQNGRGSCDPRHEDVSKLGTKVAEGGS